MLLCLGITPGLLGALLCITVGAGYILVLRSAQRQSAHRKYAILLYATQISKYNVRITWIAVLLNLIVLLVVPVLPTLIEHLTQVSILWCKLFSLIGSIGIAALLGKVVYIVVKVVELWRALRLAGLVTTREETRKPIWFVQSLDSCLIENLTEKYILLPRFHVLKLKDKCSQRLPGLVMTLSSLLIVSGVSSLIFYVDLLYFIAEHVENIILLKLAGLPSIITWGFAIFAIVFAFFLALGIISQYSFFAMDCLEYLTSLNDPNFTNYFSVNYLAIDLYNYQVRSFGFVRIGNIPLGLPPMRNGRVYCLAVTPRVRDPDGVLYIVDVYAMFEPGGPRDKIRTILVAP